MNDLPTDPPREADHAPRAHVPFQHDAPPPDVRPMSGWAVLALITAMISVAACLLTYWWLAIVPLVLAIFVLVKVSPRERRGRVLATIGLVLSLFAGSCTYFALSLNRKVITGSVGAILGALSSTGSAETQEQAISRWASQSAMEDGLVERLRTRFAAVTERFGPYQGPPEVGTWLMGNYELFTPPMSGLIEIPENPGVPVPKVAEAMWARARFGDRGVYVSIPVGTGDGEGIPKVRADGSGSWVRDLRFFVAPAGK